jgi:MFS family permease
MVMLLSAFFGICLSASIGWQWWLVLTFAIIHNIFIMADSATLTAGLVTSTPESLRGAAMGLHSLMGFGGGLLGPALFGFVLDISSGQQNPESWIWAYASIVVWGCFFVLYQLQNSKRYFDLK